MDGSSISLIVALALLLLMSAYFSACETAFTSFNRVRMKSLANEGKRRAQRVMEMSENYDKLLSTVLIGNNIVNIVATAIATVLFVGFFGNAGVTISTVVMTVLVLLFSEISPKALAKESPEQFAMAFSLPLKFLMTILAPINKLLTAWQKMLHRLFKSEDGPSMTEEELLTYVEEARQDGGINEQEEELIRTVIEFDDLDAGDIYTPRVDIEAVDINDSAGKIASLFHKTGFSRLPVYKDSIDSIVGILLAKDFNYYVDNLGKSVESTMRPVLFVPKTVKISGLLNDLQRNKIHMAVVVDEHGGTLGIVTIEDIVEELVGEIWDEHDEIREEIVPTGPHSFSVYGGADLEDMFEYFEIYNEEAASQTVGGWVIEMLERIPRKNDSFTYENLKVTVDEMRRNRVDSVRIDRKPPVQPEEAPQD